jgi:hypothetical protein
MNDSTDLRRRVGDTPIWFRLLDRFGLPTLFAIALLWHVLATGKADREERHVLLRQLTVAISANTSALEELASSERAHASAVDRAIERLAANRDAGASGRGSP